MNTQSDIDNFLVRISAEALDLEIKSREEQEKFGSFPSATAAHLRGQSSLLCWVAKIAHECGLKASFEK